MERDTSIGAGKKRKYSSDQQPAPSLGLFKLKLEAKNNEIEQLSEYVLKLEAQVADLEAEKENWETTGSSGDKENNEHVDIKNVAKTSGDTVGKMELMVKEKEKKIQELEAENKAAKVTEVKLQSENARLKKDVEDLMQRNSTLKSEIATLKEQLGRRETELKHVTVDDIHSGDVLNFDLLSSENVLTVSKLEALDEPFWNLYSTEAAEPFEMDISTIYKRTQFKINLTGSLICNDLQNPNRITEIVLAVYSWTHESLNLGFQELDDFAFRKLASDSVKTVKLQNCTVKKNTGSPMKADEIFAELPDIESFEYSFKHYKDESLQNIAEDFSKLPTFQNLKQFKFCNANNRFDLEKFGKFMKKHPDTNFVIHYHPLGQTTQLKIQGIVQKLSATCKISVELTDK